MLSDFEIENRPNTAAKTESNGLSAEYAAHVGGQLKMELAGGHPGEGPRPEPPRVEPPRVEPPRVEPPHQAPSRPEPPRFEPPHRQEPPRFEPPHREPPRSEPTHQRPEPTHQRPEPSHPRPEPSFPRPEHGGNHHDGGEGPVTPERGHGHGRGHGGWNPAPDSGNYDPGPVDNGGYNGGYDNGGYDNGGNQAPHMGHAQFMKWCKTQELKELKKHPGHHLSEKQLKNICNQTWQHYKRGDFDQS